MGPRVRRFDGAYRWFVARGLPISVNGEFCQWLGSCTDINDLKRTERALRRSNEELRQFAYAAAHDLQEPLRDISNSLGMLKRQYEDKLDAEAIQWIDASTAGARRMHYMVKDLLSYSRAVDETVRVEEPVDVAKAIRVAMENLSSTMQTTGATVEIGPLPRLHMHETHLVQVFQNLISNSTKYRKADVPPVVKISAVSEGSDWQFSITDNGIGFDPVYAEKIFGVFKRLHHRAEYPGNGIGLAICARIIAHYGGRIWAESQPDKGSTFHFKVSDSPEIR